MSEINLQSRFAVDPSVQAALGENRWRLTPATMATWLTKGAWIPYKHLLYISARIAAGIRAGNARIIVVMPPRHGKSELLSIHTPPWVLDRDPAAEVILTSYGADLATDFGRKSRDFILDHQDVLNCKLRRDSQRTDQFLTTMMGGMRAVGIGGPITGRGADLLLIDDYLKNNKDAMSETIRADCYDWYRSTARTRLEPGGSIIILATRWHVQDLIGKILEDDPKGWTVIRLPAIAEADDVLGRAIGDPLCPERRPLEELLAIKRELGTYFWQALFQQDPIPPGAGIFNASNIRMVDTLPHYSRLKWVRSWDIASSPTGGDYTVGALLALDTTTQLVYLVDIRRFQKSPNDTDAEIKTTAEVDGRFKRIRFEQEPGSAGKVAIAHYQSMLRGYSVFAERPTGDKFTRAQPFMAACEAGSICMMRAPWNKPFFDEMELFPDGPHDDQADAVSAGYNDFFRKVGRAGTFGRSASGELILPQGAESGGGGSITGATFGRQGYDNVIRMYR